MGERLKRGGPHPDGREKAEAQLLQGRSTWNNWKHVVEDRLKISFTNSHLPMEPLAHEFYVMRRKQQIDGEIDQEKVIDFWEKAEEEVPGFDEKYGNIIRFIIERIPVGTKDLMRRL